jgi:hypothetical protein
VVGDDLEPDLVTSVLGWLPSESWRRGERKRFMRPDGTERVFDSIHDRGGWKLITTDEERVRSLQDQVAAWLERLQVNGPALQSLRDRGWEVELNCFAATSECLDLPVDVLGYLAGLGVGLALTFSAGGSESAAEPLTAPPDLTKNEDLDAG